MELTLIGQWWILAESYHSQSSDHNKRQEKVFHKEIKPWKIYRLHLRFCLDKKSCSKTCYQRGSLNTGSCGENTSSKGSLTKDTLW